jgi:hypothetical protein
MHAIARHTLAAVLVAIPAAAHAQGLSDATFRAAPQFASYSFDLDGAKTSISQFAVPIAVLIPINDRLTFDLGTAFATASFDGDGVEKSSISGLTDTQLRLNYALAGNTIIVTAGINLPTGQYKIAEDKIGAAGQIGNDFLAFPISSFGNGFGGTGGVAYARNAGAWNVGLGASLRKSFEFDAFDAGGSTVTFTPATEFRVRAGADREITDGRVALGLVLSQFGDDTCDGCDGATATTFATGTRIIAQFGLDRTIGDKQLYVGGWILHRGEGERLGGTAPSENIENFLVALGLNVGSTFLEPNVELRLRQSDGESGSLFYGGVRTRLQSGSLEFSPSLSVGFGSSGEVGITGFKGGVTIRLVR